MSLRIPLTADQTLQTEFHEIERRLRKLEKATGVSANSVLRVSGGSSSTVNLAPLYDRLTALEAAIADLGPSTTYSDFNPVGSTATNGLVPSPGQSEPPTGTAQHVLTESGWGFPLRGLVGVATSGEHTDPPYDVIDVEGAIHAQHIQSGNVNCYGLYTQGDIEYGDTFWEDLRVEPTARTTGANAPTFEKWLDDAGGTSRGVYLYSFDDAAAGSEKEIFFSTQMPHGWKEGTAIYPHVHWIGNVSDTTATVRWGLEYAFVDIGEAYGDTTTIYGAGNIPSGDEGTPDPDVTAFKHYLTSFGPIATTATSNGISAILIGRIWRDSANAGDTYNAATNKAGLLSIDIHYEVDSPGSSDRYTK